MRPPPLQPCRAATFGVLTSTNVLIKVPKLHLAQSDALRVTLKPPHHWATVARVIVDKAKPSNKTSRRS
ncbi:anthranilate synthase [Sesbania bispinosa]|nr:anthranilate synthase [Sesbania bispinosa]